MAKRLPRGFRRGHGGDIACPHRDVSCCAACVAKHPELVDVLGQVFFVPDEAERAALLADLERLRAAVPRDPGEKVNAPTEACDRVDTPALRVEWENDPDPLDKWDGIGQRPPFVFAAFVRDPRGHYCHLASVGSIDVMTPTDPYLHEVEADLLKEAHHALQKPPVPLPTEAEMRAAREYARDPVRLTAKGDSAR